MPATITIRPARADDAPELALLSGELGYPATTEAMSARLPALLDDPWQLVLVAARSDDRALAWLHAAVRRQLDSDPCVEVVGLVVGENCRGGRLGAALLAAAESWAWSQELDTVILRSNIVRERAHAFYLREGYERVKSSHLFRKRAPVRGPGPID